MDIAPDVSEFLFESDTDQDRCWSQAGRLPFENVKIASFISRALLHHFWLRCQIIGDHELKSLAQEVRLVAENVAIRRFQASCYEELSLIVCVNKIFELVVNVPVEICRHKCLAGFVVRGYKLSSAVAGVLIAESVELSRHSCGPVGSKKTPSFLRKTPRANVSIQWP